MPTAHDRLLQQAQARWMSGNGPARLRAELPALQGDAPMQVEYEFFHDGAPKTRARLAQAQIVLEEPVELVPVAIPKPWGREIWYTGMEARGESGVRAGSGTLALSQYLALAPEQICAARPVVLLKILDPRPEPVLGDLYLETHAQKHEVYVVTHVDESAWPEGIGAIRLGVDQDLRRSCGTDQAFRDAFLSAVKAYEAVRRRIDAGATQSAEAERQSRANMDRFTSVASLQVGDVVSVPPWMPHSLQHGVRVAELQTPTYERLIISFAQRVLTQNHWDSERAIARLNLDPPAPAELQPVAPGVERIAPFTDFAAWRVQAAPGATLRLTACAGYAACLCVSGAVVINGMRRGAEEACFVPGGALPVTIHNPHATAATCLVAGAEL